MKARAPHSQLKRNILFTLLIIFCNNNVLADSPKLLFALDVIRHGDRTSIRDIPNASHEWKEGRGQLTAKGMQQEYELGAKLRKKYIFEEKLLPEHYQPNSLYVRSTDVDRTLMSAQSLLLGLYPVGKANLPNAFQPIPIHTQIADDKDALLVFTHSDLFKQLFENYVKPSAAWKAKDEALKKHYPRWSKATGLEIKELFQLISVGNTLAVYQNNNVKLPPLLSKEDYHEITQAGKWAFCYLFTPKEVAKSMGQPLLGLIISYLQAPHEDLKYVLLSGHDSSLLALLSALGVPLKEPPPFASRVNFSLYEQEKQQYIVITYNDIELQVPGCNGNQCHSQYLISLAEGAIPTIEHKTI